MTREEAKAYFKRHIDLYCVTGICREAEEMAIQALEQESSVSENPNNCEMRDATLEERESIDKYIKSISKPTGVKFGALEQEPSGDCISRQAVLAEIFKKPAWHNSDGSYYHADDIRDAVNSVKPQERTGHWEWIQYDSNPNIGNWHCSECRTIIPHMPEKTDNTPIYKWCPMCDARMVESQETKPEISSYYGLKSYVRERSE